jgi:hypothetical protein
VDQQHFRSCINSGQDLDVKINGDVELAKKLRVIATPTFLIGRVQSDGSLVVTEVLSGIRPMKDFERALGAVLHGTSQR